MSKQSSRDGQKLRLATLLHKPDFNYLTPIRSLAQEHQCTLLQRVVELELSLSELQSEANNLKQQLALKKAFVKLTNVESWEEAQEKFPHFATQEQLGRFIHIDLKKKSFTDFCHRAKTSGSQSVVSSSSTVVIGGSRASVVVSMITEVNGSLIRQSGSLPDGLSLDPNIVSRCYVCRECGLHNQRNKFVFRLPPVRCCHGCIC